MDQQEPQAEAPNDNVELGTEPSPVDFTILEGMRKLYPANALDFEELLNQMTAEELKAYILEVMTKEAEPLQLPPLDSNLATILGMPNFRCAPIAHLFQATTHPDVPKRSEEEQAFVIHRLTNMYLTNPEGWRDDITKEVQARQAMVDGKTTKVEEKQDAAAAPEVVEKDFQQAEEPAVETPPKPNTFPGAI